jgi:hypothetical protein
LRSSQALLPHQNAPVCNRIAEHSRAYVGDLKFNRKMIFRGALAKAALVFVLQGRHVDKVAKNQSEVALVAKTHRLADLGNGQIRRRQQMFRLGHPEMIQITDEGLSRHLLEEPHKV